MLLKEKDRLSRSSLSILRKFYTTYKNAEGLIEPKVVLENMRSFGFEVKHPFIYSLFSELDTKENEGGLEYDDLVDFFNSKLNDMRSDKAIERLFSLFKKDENAFCIEFRDLKRIAQEEGDEMTDEEINNMLRRLSGGAKEMDYDHFYAAMKKELVQNNE